MMIQGLVQDAVARLIYAASALAATRRLNQARPPATSMLPLRVSIKRCRKWSSGHLLPLRSWNQERRVSARPMMRLPARMVGGSIALGVSLLHTTAELLRPEGRNGMIMVRRTQLADRCCMRRTWGCGSSGSLWIHRNLDFLSCNEAGMRNLGDTGWSREPEHPSPAAFCILSCGSGQAA